MRHYNVRPTRKAARKYSIPEDKERPILSVSYECKEECDAWLVNHGVESPNLPGIAEDR